MPKPRRYEGVIVVSGYLPLEAREVLSKARELAKREGISLSELVGRSLVEYVGSHYPGNPQTLLIEAKPDPMRDAFRHMRLRVLKGILSNPWPDREAWLEALERALKSAARYGASARDPEVRRALEILKASSQSQSQDSNADERDESRVMGGEGLGD